MTPDLAALLAPYTAGTAVAERHVTVTRPAVAEQPVPTTAARRAAQDRFNAVGLPRGVA